MLLMPVLPSVSVSVEIHPVCRLTIQGCKVVFLNIGCRLRIIDPLCTVGAANIQGYFNSFTCSIK